MIACPHCGKKTELVGPKTLPSAIAPERRSGVGWLVAATIVVAGGAFWLFFSQKHGSAKSAPTAIISPVSPSTNSVVNPKPAAPSSLVAAYSTNGLTVGKITLEKAKGSSVVYAVGELKNDSDHQRFGLKIELDLLDTNEARIGAATDYLAILEPRKSWYFKALVLEGKAARARVAAIIEEK